MKSSRELKPSRFNIELPLEKMHDGILLVFNTFTQALSLFESQVWRRIVSGAQEKDLIPSIEKCRDQMLLVERNFDETRLLMGRKMEMAYDTGMLSFKAVVTDHCNFACSYCIEEGYRGKRHMNMTTARQTANFMVDNIRLYRPHTVALDMSGGEPLLNIPAMNIIAETVSLFCRGANIPCDISFITNGYLLAPARIHRLIRAGVNTVRVSLLPRKFHDTLRRDRKGEPTYERVVANMESIKGEVKFCILSQYDAENTAFIDAMPAFLRDLENRGIKESVKEMNVGMILRREYGLKNADEFCGDLGEFHNYRAIVDLVRSHGFFVPDGPPGNDCVANHRGRFIIGPEGSLASCPTMLDHPELTVGSVWTGVDPLRKSQIMTRPLPQSCSDECVLAPRCNGGCRYQALIRSGSFDEIYCNYDFHMAQLKDYLLRRAEEFLSRAGNRFAA